MAPRRLLSLWLRPQPRPNASAVPADLPGLALWCQRYSPLTAPDPPDGVMIDISGCAHLFGGEAGLAAHIRHRLPGARLAIADSAAAAWGLARYGAEGATDLPPLPLAALRLAPPTIMKLRRVGVRRIGELARLPRAELTAGYGPEPALRLAQAFGHAPEVLPFITAPPEWRQVEHYAEPIFTPAQLRAALERMATRLCAQLAAAQRGATALKARFYRIDAQCPEIHLGFATPCRDDTQISKLLGEKLAQTIDPGFGVEAISLQADITEALAPAQNSILHEAKDYTAPINTILNRLGGDKFWRAAAHSSHIPEYAARRVPITMPPVPWARPRHPRPTHLLARPDAITAIAPVPDDPPVMFSWRGQSHKIIHATGPERIAREWWAHAHDDTRPETEKIRDYYQVEDTSGARFWLFRAGLHDGAAPARWYLHGFFG